LQWYIELPFGDLQERSASQSLWGLGLRTDSPIGFGVAPINIG